jgi:hypothetical protein
MVLWHWNSRQPYYDQTGREYGQEGLLALYRVPYMLEVALGVVIGVVCILRSVQYGARRGAGAGVTMQLEVFGAWSAYVAIQTLSLAFASMQGLTEFAPRLNVFEVLNWALPAWGVTAVACGFGFRMGRRWQMEARELIPVSPPPRDCQERSLQRAGSLHGS